MLTLSVCGYNQPTPEDPNGASWWLTCGLDGGGFHPPMVKVDQLVTAELTADGIFAPCSQFFDKFHQYGGEFGRTSFTLVCRSYQFLPSSSPPSLFRSQAATLM